MAEIVQRVSLEGGKEVEAQFASMAAAGEASAKKIQAAFSTNKLGDQFVAISRSIKAGFTDIATAAGTIGRAFSNVSKAGDAFGASLVATERKVIGLTAAVTAATVGIGIFFQKAAAGQEALAVQADAFGLSIEQFQKVSELATISGVDQGGLELFLAKFTAGVGKATEAADTLGKTTKETTKSIEDFSVATESGGTATIKVVRGAQDAKTALEGVGLGLKSGIEGATEFAQRVAAIGNRAERLAFIGKELGVRATQAAALTPFLLSLAAGFDKGTRAAQGFVPVINETENALGQKLDDAFDKLIRNLQLTRDHLAIAFDPVVLTVVERFNKLIVDNFGSLQRFASILSNQVAVAVQDLFHLFSGNDAQVVNKWMLDIRDNVIAVKDAFVTTAAVIVEAVHLISAALAPIGSLINAIFGTNINGLAVLIDVLVLRWLGFFKIVGSGLRLLKVTFTEFIGVVRVLGPLLVGAISGLTALIVRNPVVALFLALTVASAKLKGGLNETQKASVELSAALNSLDQSQRAAADGTDESTKALHENEKAQLSAARVAIFNAELRVDAAKAELAAQQAINDRLKETFPDIVRSGPTPEEEALHNATVALVERQKALDEIRQKIDSFATASKAAVPPLQELGKAAAETDAHVRTLGQNDLHGWSESMRANVKFVTADMKEAADVVTGVSADVTKAFTDLSSVNAKTPSLDTGKLDAARQQATQAVDAWAEAFTKITDIQSQIADAGTALINTLADAIQKSGPAITKALFDLGDTIDSAFKQAVINVPVIWKETIAKLGEATGASGLHLVFAEIVKDVEQLWSDGITRMAAKLDELTSRLKDVQAQLASASGERFGPPSTNVEDFRNPANTQLTGAVSAVDQASKVISGILDQLSARFDAVANGFSEAFFEAVATFPATLQVVMDRLSGIIQTSVASFRAAFSGLGVGAEAAFNEIPAVLQTAMARLELIVRTASNGIVTAFQSAREQIIGIWQSMIATLAQLFSNLVVTISGLISQLVSRLASLRAAIASAQAQLAQAQSSSGERRAQGGPVYGPGTSTSDSIKTWLSHGEYVLKASAVQKIGVNVLNRLNAGALKITEKSSALAPVVNVLVAAGASNSSEKISVSSFREIIQALPVVVKVLMAPPQTNVSREASREHVLDRLVRVIERAPVIVNHFSKAAPAFGYGGLARGPGTGTSDSILARLSAGEYVIRAEVVQRLGVPFFDRLNRGVNSTLEGLRGSLAGLSFDGALDSLTPRFASGGLVAASAGGIKSGERPVVLNIGGESFPMVADSDVVEKLFRFSAQKRIKSNGVKPAWWGG